MSEELKEQNTLKEIKEVAQELGARFETFKKSNDEQMTTRFSGLSGKVDTLNEKISELETAKKGLEQEIIELKRPAFNKSEVDTYQKAFNEFVKTGNTNEELMTKGFDSSTGSTGAFAIPEQFDKRIMELLRDESPMRRVCGHLSIGTPNYRRLVNLGGTASGWVGETDARPETTVSKLAQIEPVMGEIYANPAAAQNVLDDAFFNVEQWLQEEARREFADKEGWAFLKGDGSKKPKGLLSYAINEQPDAQRPFGTLQAVKSGGDGTGGASAYFINGDSLINLIHQLKHGYRNNAVWMMAGLTVAYIRRLKDADGNYLWRPGIEAGQPSTLFGRPIVENEDMDGIGKDNNAVLFGDFKRAYTVVDRMGTTLLRDPYTHKPYVHFYMTKRVGGMLLDSQAVKVLKLSK